MADQTAGCWENTDACEPADGEDKPFLSCRLGLSFQCDLDRVDSYFKTAWGAGIGIKVVKEGVAPQVSITGSFLVTLLRSPQGLLCLEILPGHVVYTTHTSSLALIFYGCEPRL